MEVLLWIFSQLTFLALIAIVVYPKWNSMEFSFSWQTRPSHHPPPSNSRIGEAVSETPTATTK